MRAVPDVAYDASSASPFGVYETSTYSGWLQVYGTSAGSPQWAALVAIADQGLALAGKGSLDGPTQTLPKLYQLPRTDFHDITSGSNGGYSAGPGYDLVTGIGTPLANSVVAGLVGSSSSGTPPTVVTPASATPNPVTGTTTNLSVLGNDASGQTSLTYTWSVTSIPAGAQGPSFSANGTNAAQNTIATFHQAGSYTFQVTITDPSSLTATSSVTVTVNQTLTGITVTPNSAAVGNGANQQFSASAVDQFGKAMSSQPAFAWSLASGIGIVNSTGMFTAPASGTGSASVQASAGGMNGAATVTVGSVPAIPTNLSATAISNRQVNLTWQNNSSNATSIIIQRSTNGSSWSQLATVTGTATSYSDSTVSKHKTYYYRVCASNTMGNSGYSNTATVVTPNAQPAVQALSAQSNSLTTAPAGQASGSGQGPITSPPPTSGFVQGTSSSGLLASANTGTQGGDQQVESDFLQVE
jgi:hypothetical protein